MTSLANINLETVYMTNGRDYRSGIGYEFLICAYEVEPSQRALDGSPFPITLQRKGGFRTNAAAKRAGRAWARENLPC
jgi:hypothetical protein